jgi:hypothetical protein
VAGSTSKKVVILRFDREPLSGFVNPQSYQQMGGIEFLSPSGSLHMVPYGEVKVLYFVRDFDGTPPARDALVFQTRPKTAGVWIRMKFRDGEIMDGLMPNNLLQLEPYGFTFIPPGPGANSQRAFVPRAALTELQVVSVVGSPLRAHKPKPKPKSQQQIELFE